MSKFMISNLIGVLTGIVSSVIVWWFLAKYLAPKLTFSRHLVKHPLSARGCGSDYQFKFMNCRRRMVVDVQLAGYLVVPSFPRKNVNQLWKLTFFSRHIPALITTRKAKHVNRKISFNLEDEELLEIFRRDYIPDDTRARALEKRLRLEDLFSLPNDPYILVLIIATDAVSGATKVFKSRKYRQRDIVVGDFDPNTLAAIPTPTADDAP